MYGSLHHSLSHCIYFHRVWGCECTVAICYFPSPKLQNTRSLLLTTEQIAMFGQAVSLGVLCERLAAFKGRILLDSRVLDDGREKGWKVLFYAWSHRSSMTKPGFCLLCILPHLEIAWFFLNTCQVQKRTTLKPNNSLDLIINQTVSINAQDSPFQIYFFKLLQVWG